MTNKSVPEGHTNGSNQETGPQHERTKLLLDQSKLKQQQQFKIFRTKINAQTNSN